MTEDSEHERAIKEAGRQIAATLEEMTNVIATANTAFQPHATLAQQAATRAERLELYRDAAGPIRRYAERLGMLEKNLRDQIEAYTVSFESRFGRPEPGTHVFVPMLEETFATVRTFKKQIGDQRAAAAIVRGHKAEPHLTQAFDHVVTVLTDVIADADTLLAFAQRSLSRLKPQ